MVLKLIICTLNCETIRETGAKEFNKRSNLVNNVLKK